MRKTPSGNVEEMPENGREILRKAFPYLWPADKPWVKRRVVIALMILFLAKVIAVTTPFFFKAAVDALAGDGDSATWLLGVGAVALTIFYGLTRLLNVGFQQLRDAVFARIIERGDGRALLKLEEGGRPFWTRAVRFGLEELEKNLS